MIQQGILTEIFLQILNMCINVYKRLYINQRYDQRYITFIYMTRDKSSAVNRRVLTELSWPMGNSVNSGVSADRYLDIEFILTYPSFDNITDQVLKLGKSCEIFKIDISRVFRHVPIDPGDLDL